LRRIYRAWDLKSGPDATALHCIRARVDYRSISDTPGGATKLFTAHYGDLQIW
jgi:hypothetical protein